MSTDYYSPWIRRNTTDVWHIPAGQENLRWIPLCKWETRVPITAKTYCTAALWKPPQKQNVCKTCVQTRHDQQTVHKVLKRMGVR